MKTESILVENLKCGGCASTIKSKIGAIEGVSAVQVDTDTSTVTAECADNLDRSLIIEKLAGIGYPEAGSANSLLTQAKSYASCMIGKIDNLNK